MTTLVITDMTEQQELHRSTHDSLTVARKSTMAALTDLKRQRNEGQNALGTRAQLSVLFSAPDGENALDIAMSDGHKWRAEITD